LKSTPVKCINNNLIREDTEKHTQRHLIENQNPLPHILSLYAYAAVTQIATEEIKKQHNIEACSHKAKVSSLGNGPWSLSTGWPKDSVSCRICSRPA
jgi:hypothetical protein